MHPPTKRARNQVRAAGLLMEYQAFILILEAGSLAMALESRLVSRAAPASFMSLSTMGVAMSDRMVERRISRLMVSRGSIRMAIRMEVLE